MSEFVKSLRARIADQEEQRMGDVYSECEKRGCSRYFAKSFCTRAELFPMKQTLSFLENKPVNKEHLKQWEIFVQVLIEKKPEHEKCEEWKRSIKVLHNEL